MKRNFASLSELDPRAYGQKIKVRIIDLQPRQDSAVKVPHQRISLLDNKGNKMTSTLFGGDIDVYKSIIKRGRTYEITNARVKEVTPKYASFPGERQLYFTNNTVIQHIDEEGNLTEDDAPPCTIENIPAGADDFARFDLMCVVVAVDDEKTIHTRSGATFRMREMFVTDDSTERIILVSAWNKFTLRQFEEMAQRIKTYPVVLVTAVKVSTFDNFSLATTMSTELVFDSTSTRAVALRAWAASNKASFDARFLLSHPRQPTYPLAPTSVADVLAMKGDTIAYTEVLKLQVHILDFSSTNIHVTLGCSSCGRTCEAVVTAVGTDFLCSSCSFNAKAESKVYFRFNCTDGTGTINLDAYTRNSEKLLEIESDTLYQMDSQGRADLFARVQRRFRESSISLVIAPVKNLLVHHGVVKWVLKDVLP